MTVYKTKTSPFAPQYFPQLPNIKGIQIDTCRTNNARYKGRDDLLIMTFQEGTKVAGVTTQSSITSVSVDWCRQYLPKGHARALVVNSGNANAFTGKKGEKSACDIAKATARLLKCQKENVFMASTGIIGEILEAKPIIDKLHALEQNNLGMSDWKKAAQAIMTTDTFPKAVTQKVKISGQTVTLNGIAKGSGMIAPNMATVLAFIFTDAPLSPPVLRQLLRMTIPDSFNSITVDSDTSTSDMVLFFSTSVTPHQGKPIRSAHDPRLNAFRKSLTKMTQELAQQIIRDGEGITKFITVKIKGAKSNLSARKIALSIANSPLVKTAIAGEDANWGRIIMAIGKSGEPAHRDKLRINIGGFPVARQGAAIPHYDERPITQHMQGQEIILEAHMGVGKGEAEIWTSDLTHDYISINADYRS